MSLLLPPLSCSHSSTPSLALVATMAHPFQSPPLAANPLVRLQHRNSISKPSLLNGIRSPSPCNRVFVFEKPRQKLSASTDDTGKEMSSLDLPSKASEQSVPVDKLPLESKLQERLEQKLKMKLAKKIRLRRKRLVRKRHLRKKGRWPPSKMKKNKNV